MRLCSLVTQLSILLLLSSCSLSPDRVGLGVGRTFADGNHLEYDGWDIRNADNDDLTTAWVYGEWDLKPQVVRLETPREAPQLTTWDRRLVKIESTSQEDQLDVAEQTLSLVESTAWETLWKVALLVLIAGGGLFFWRWRKKRKLAE